MAISRYKVVERGRNSFCAKKPWAVKYEKGKIVKGRNGTGVFVFETLDDAKRYNEKFCNAGTIIRVLPIGRGFKPKFRPANFANDTIKRFWADINITKRGCRNKLELANILRIHFMQVEDNDGTIIYPAVRVME